MPADPTLEALIAGGHYAIAADRYEEETGDAELAALMRIDGLEWELVNGMPVLLMTTEFKNTTNHISWWHIRCGRFDFGSASYEPTMRIHLPRLLAETAIPSILAASGYGTWLTDRFYQAYNAAVVRVLA